MKFSKVIVPVCALVLVGYCVYFYSLGYISSYLLGIWAALVVVSIFVSKQNPHWVYLGLAVASFVLRYLVKSQIPEASLFPHGEILVLIPILFLGAGIDGLYWVKKWERGAKVKTGYDN